VGINLGAMMLFATTAPLIGGGVGSIPRGGNGSGS
jgi:hypothetical protein